MIYTVGVFHNHSKNKPYIQGGSILINCDFECQAGSNFIIQDLEYQSETDFDNIRTFVLGFAKFD